MNDEHLAGCLGQCLPHERQDASADRDVVRLLAGEDPIARWTRIYEERRGVYEDVADFALDTSTGPLSDVVATIVAWARAEESAPASTEETA